MCTGPLSMTFSALHIRSRIGLLIASPCFRCWTDGYLSTVSETSLSGGSTEISVQSPTRRAHIRGSSCTSQLSGSAKNFFHRTTTSNLVCVGDGSDVAPLVYLRWVKKDLSSMLQRCVFLCYNSYLLFNTAWYHSDTTGRNLVSGICGDCLQVMCRSAVSI